MLTKSKLLALVTATGLAVAAYTGAAGAVDTPFDDVQNDPCAQADLPQCQDDDDPVGPPGFDPDLEFCFSIEPEEDCVESEDPGGDPGEEEPGVGVPTADPADPVTGTPNFTG